MGIAFVTRAMAVGSKDTAIVAVGDLQRRESVRARAVNWQALGEGQSARVWPIARQGKSGARARSERVPPWGFASWTMT